MVQNLFQKINAEQTLSRDENLAWKKLLTDFTCCQIAQENDVGLLVDAEEYNMQIAADQVVLDLMRERTRKAAVYNTVQLYLRWKSSSPANA